MNQRDFFPYADGEDKYWSGYFTSRPTQKGYIRDASCLYRAAAKLSAKRLAHRLMMGLEY